MQMSLEIALETDTRGQVVSQTCW